MICNPQSQSFPCWMHHVMHATRSRFRFVTLDANPDRRLLHRTSVPATRLKTGTLLLRCTDEEAEGIRHAAKSEQRTLSGYILNAVLSRIDAKEKLLREAGNRLESPKVPLPNTPRQV